MHLPAILGPTQPSLNVVHALKKPGMFTAPKMTGIKIQPVHNGLRVFHNYDGAPQKKFVFTSPSLMTTHIKRAIKNEWLTPEGGATGEAKKIEHALNL
jgi:glucose dehydrogenase